jgi:hypothetical protein
MKDALVVFAEHRFDLCRFEILLFMYNDIVDSARPESLKESLKGSLV